MTSSDHHFEVLKELVLRAHEQPPASRLEWLEIHCPDPDLRAEVESIVAHGVPEDSRLQTGGPLIQLESSPAPDRIGPYELLYKIGEGGFGEVYAAEQKEPLRRRVAVKILKRGMDSRSILARFHAERQALARMEHPNIARILDAGESPTGLPYFVMEWIRGERITHYCDQRSLALEARLRLIVDVCFAIDHAHSKGVIHRDIKPSNILVSEADGTPIPKVIDFGIAKAIAAPLTEETLYTAQGQIIGTPEYMSPEQARGAKVTPSTDIYSVGAVLYEILVGTPPLDHEHHGVTDPNPDIATPSERLSRLPDADSRARLRRATLDPLRKDLQRGPDWIVMRALQNRPEERYASARELAEDLQRYLRGEWALAAPSSAAARVLYGYQRAVSQTARGVAKRIGGFGVTFANAFRAQRIAEERDRARRELDRAERIAGFLADTLSGVEPSALGLAIVDDLCVRIERAECASGVAPETAKQEANRLRERLTAVNPTDLARRVLDENILDQAGRKIDARLGDEPEIAARIRATFGSTYRQLGLYEKAEPYIRQALAQRRSLFGPQHAETLNSMNSLTQLLQEQERWEEAESNAREAHLLSERALGGDHPETLSALANLGTLLTFRGNFQEAEPVRRRSMLEHERVYGPHHPESITAIGNLGSVLMYLGRATEAETLVRRCFALAIENLGEDDALTMTARGNLGQALEQLGRTDEAETISRDQLRIHRHLNGDHHYDTLMSMINLGAFCEVAGKLEEANALFQEALAGFKSLVGPNHSRTLAANHNLGCVLKAMGKLNEAEPVLADGLVRMKQSLGPDHMHTLVGAAHYGDALRLQGRHKESKTILDEAIERAERTLQPNDWLNAVLLQKSGLTRLALGDAVVAETQLIRAYELYHDALGDTRRTRGAADDIAELYRQTGRLDLARTWAARGAGGS